MDSGGEGPRANLEDFISIRRFGVFLDSFISDAAHSFISRSCSHPSSMWRFLYKHLKWFLSEHFMIHVHG